MTSGRDAPEYLALRSLDEVERYHAQIQLAERDGAVRVERDRRVGDGSKLMRLAVSDLGKLAAHLGVRPNHEKAATAQEVLAPWLAGFPVLQEILDLWGQGRKVRGHDADAAHDLADAAGFVAARMTDNLTERVLRRESVRHFGDSKRLEKLTHWLEILAFGQLTASGFTEPEIWSAIGIRREPQPLLVSGDGSVRIKGHPVPLPIIEPYLGLPPERVDGCVSSARYLLTIENLATFHDALAPLRQSRGLVIYTGGMPSPAWRAAYQRLLRGLPGDLPLFHWGDIDQGGFRIAAVVADAAASVGRTCQPWMMSPKDLPPALAQRAAKASPGTVSAMVSWAERAQWHALAQPLRDAGIVLEQEALDPAPPF